MHRSCCWPDNSAEHSYQLLKVEKHLFQYRCSYFLYQGRVSCYLVRVVNDFLFRMFPVHGCLLLIIGKRISEIANTEFEEGHDVGM